MIVVIVDGRCLDIFEILKDLLSCLFDLRGCIHVLLIRGGHMDPVLRVEVH